MTQNNPPPPLSVVRVERPEQTFGETMNEIRSWLDSRKIQPAAFKADTTVPGAVAFEIRFSSEDEARLFQRAFAWCRSAPAA